MYFRVLIVFCRLVLVFGLVPFFRERRQRDDDVLFGVCSSSRHLIRLFHRSCGATSRCLDRFWSWRSVRALARRWASAWGEFVAAGTGGLATVLLLTRRRNSSNRVATQRA